MNRRRVALAALVALFLLAVVTPSWIACGSQAEPDSARSAAAPGATAASAPASAAPSASEDSDTNAEPSVSSAAPADVPVAGPLVILAVGVAIVLGLIIVLKINAFIALITAAMVVSLLAPGDIASKISRVAAAFGSAAGGIGIVIAMAAVIGKCMLDSGAADRIVRAFLRMLGEKRAPVALLGSGFVLAVPVFFDTVFYLLVPLARSLHRKTGRQFLKYVLAIAAGGAITHTLVPPTPGPLLMAENLGIDVGWMIMIGALVALPAAVAGLVYSELADRRMPVPMRPLGSEPEPEPLPDDQLPSLGMSLLPVLLPVVLISTSTILTAVADSQHAALLEQASVSDWPQLRSAIEGQAASSEPSPGRLIWNHPAMTDQARDLLRNDAPLAAGQRAPLVAVLNEILGDKSFYQEEAFRGVVLNDVARSTLDQLSPRMKKVTAERLNRALLESAYPSIRSHTWDTGWRKAADISDVFGNANLALLLSAVIAIWVLAAKRGLSRSQIAHVVEQSLMSGGVIILITAGGGAFGKMLDAAQIGPAIQSLFAGTGGPATGSFALLLLGFVIAAVLKIAQGSSTVAMIVGSGMMAAIVAGQELAFNPVYLATAIGSGSLFGSWMNDSGFWIFAKMSGLTETEALKSWTPMLIVLALVGLGTSMLFAALLPLTGA
jgi:H+/gluconate symporter-like permease